MSKPFSVALALLLTSSAGWAESGEQPEALIGTSEQLESHVVGAERISDHEEQSEQIDQLEGSSRGLEGMSVPAEKLSDHHATSETLEGRSVQSERLSGMGHPADSGSEGLAKAEQALREARAAHPESHREHGPAARAQQPHAQSSSFGSGGHSQWMARLHLQQQRVRVAQSKQEVMDARYAQMLHRDYPRGEARQQIIDERERAKSRLEAERETSQRLVEQARQAGVPQNILEMNPQ